MTAHKQYKISSYNSNGCHFLVSEGRPPHRDLKKSSFSLENNFSRRAKQSPQKAAMYAQIPLWLKRPLPTPLKKDSRILAVN